jgi:hypothetical protein
MLLFYFEAITKTQTTKIKYYYVMINRINHEFKKYFVTKHLRLFQKHKLQRFSRI